MRPPPARSSALVAPRRAGYQSAPAYGPGDRTKGWMPVPVELLEMLDVWNTACSVAAKAAIFPNDRLYWEERAQTLRALCERIRARHNGIAASAATEGGQRNSGWTFVPAELVEMLEDLDTACIQAGAAEQAQSAGMGINWEECIDTQRAARRLMDSAAAPARHVPLVR